MKVSFDSKGDFDNAIKFLGKCTNMEPRSILENYAKIGVESLRANTPKRSGETAAGWDYRIIQNGNKNLEVEFYNHAHPELNVNLAVLIQLGHGTRTGGYVPPVNYIQPAMNPVYKAVGDELVRRLE